MMQAGRRSQCALVRCLYTRALPENEIPPAKLVDIYSSMIENISQ
jgi:hypothetical protein